MKSAETFLRQQLDQGKTPGIHYAISKGDETLYRFAGGLADVAGAVPVDHKTSFHAYSVTKTFTALAILQLVEKGLLTLEQSVQALLPEMPYPQHISVRHLLTHTAGIPSPIPLRWIHLAKEHEGFDENGFFKKIFAQHPKPSAPPGQKFSYSNLGYVLLGQVIEKVTGQTYQQYVTEHILSKLGLPPGEIGFAVSDPAHHAKGYHRRWSFSNLLLGFLLDKSKFMGETEGAWQVFRTNYVNGSAYGGLVGTPAAFARYAQMLSAADHPLLGADLTQLLFTENHTADGRPTGMCLSWFTGMLSGKRFVAHAGGGGGSYCEVRIYPDEGYSSVMMSNRTGMQDERLLSRVDGFFFS